MKSLISGSSGFIGSHLTEHLKQLGHTVVPIDRERLKLLDHLREFFVKEQPDYIFHLAAYGNMNHQRDEQEIFQANVVGTWNMLQASKEIPYKAFINFGSSSEYGKKDKPMKETDLPETDTFYGASKVAGTYLARSFARQYSKPIVTVRPFSVYGPGEADFRFIPIVCKALCENSPIKLADGFHDWIYIVDFIDAVERILNVISLNQIIPPFVVNIGIGKRVGNNLIVALLQEISGIQIPKLPYEAARPNDSIIWKANNKLLKSLGWKQKYSLEEGLKMTYEYYKEKYEKQGS